MHRWTRCPAFAAAALVLLSFNPAGAADDDSFNRNTPVTINVGFGPGSGYSVWSRLLARHIGNHLPGQPNVIVKNMPGAGSLVAANYLYNVAPKDGTAWGAFSRNLPGQALIGRKGVRFDPRQFGWIGSPTIGSRICAVMSSTGVRTIEDVRSKQVVMAGLGVATAPSFVPKLLNQLVGTKFKVVDGYQSAGDAHLAMERGEVSGICQTHAVLRTLHPDWLKSGKVHILFSMESKRNPQLKDTPTIFEFVQKGEKKQILQFVMAATELGTPFLTTRGLPKGRLEAIRKAFDATMKDAAFLKEAAKLKVDVSPVSGAELSELVDELYKIPAPIVAKARALMTAGKKPKKKTN